MTIKEDLQLRKEVTVMRKEGRLPMDIDAIKYVLDKRNAREVCYQVRTAEPRYLGEVISFAFTDIDSFHFMMSSLDAPALNNLYEAIGWLEYHRRDGRPPEYYLSVMDSLARGTSRLGVALSYASGLSKPSSVQSEAEPFTFEASSYDSVVRLAAHTLDNYYDLQKAVKPLMEGLSRTRKDAQARVYGRILVLLNMVKDFDLQHMATPANQAKYLNALKVAHELLHEHVPTLKSRFLLLQTFENALSNGHGMGPEAESYLRWMAHGIGESITQEFLESTNAKILAEITGVGGKKSMASKKERLVATIKHLQMLAPEILQEFKMAVASRVLNSENFNEVGDLALGKELIPTLIEGLDAEVLLSNLKSRGRDSLIKCCRDVTPFIPYLDERRQTKSMVMTLDI